MRGGAPAPPFYRTGLVALLLLALVGTEPDEIVSDYERSYERMRSLFVELGEEDQGPMIQEFLRREKTSARAIILDLLTAVDVKSYLLAADVTDDDVRAIPPSASRQWGLTSLSG